MHNLSRNYIVLGLVWVVVGMIFGTWLGATNQLNYSNSHAHMNLLGFVTSVLFGLLHWAYPALAKSRAAVAQFAIYEIGVLILVIGKVMVDGGNESFLLVLGSLVTIVGATLMLAMFVRYGKET